MKVSASSAPPGAVPCYLCHRYLPQEKLADFRCIDRDACQRAATRMLGRPKQLSKRAAKKLGLG